MANFSLDSDLLVADPNIFALRFSHQLLASGTDGTTDASGLVFGSDSADFEAAGIDTGRVVCIVISGARRSWSVYERLSENTLKLASLAPASQTGLEWSVHTFASQHEQITREILERSGVNLDDSAETRTTDNVLNASAVRRVAVLGVLALIYRAQANNIQTNSDWWLKAGYYEERYRSELEQLAIEWDTDLSGSSDYRTGGGRSLLGRS